MARLSDFDTTQKYVATIDRSERLTPEGTEEVREIVMEVKQKGFSCEINQSFGVLIDAPSDFGNTTHHRLYSVADLPGEKNGNPMITFLVKRCSYVDDLVANNMKASLQTTYVTDASVMRSRSQVLLTYPSLFRKTRPPISF